MQTKEPTFSDCFQSPRYSDFTQSSIASINKFDKNVIYYLRDSIILKSDFAEI